MRRILLLTITLLVGINFLSSPTARTQEPGGDKLPNPEDYSAGENCKNKRKLTPLVDTPDEPGTKYQSRCVLSFWNCQTRKTEIYRTDPHGPEARCDHYWKRRAELGEREVCCDRPEVKCSPATPWFNPSSSGCKDVQTPKITRVESLVTLSLCGYPIWSVASRWGGTRKPDIEGAIEARDALTARVRSQVGSRICCDKFREAVSSGSPCDPRADLDCDGKSNREDTSYRQRFLSSRDNETYVYSGSLPDINIFSKPEGASIDPFPQGLNPDDPNFIPPADKCQCKWELVKGTLTCSPDEKQPHVYQGRWRCPSSGNETFTRKEAPATVPCK